MVGACALHDLMFRWVNASGPTLSGPTPPAKRPSSTCCIFPRSQAAQRVALLPACAPPETPLCSCRPLRSAQKAPQPQFDRRRLEMCRAHPQPHGVQGLQGAVWTGLGLFLLKTGLESTRIQVSERM